MGSDVSSLTLTACGMAVGLVLAAYAHDELKTQTPDRMMIPKPLFFMM
jgi:hypothetical protein